MLAVWSLICLPASLWAPLKLKSYYSLESTATPTVNSTLTQLRELSEKKNDTTLQPAASSRGSVSIPIKAKASIPQSPTFLIHYFQHTSVSVQLDTLSQVLLGPSTFLVGWHPLPVGIYETCPLRSLWTFLSCYLTFDGLNKIRHTSCAYTSTYKQYVLKLILFRSTTRHFNSQYLYLFICYLWARK